MYYLSKNYIHCQLNNLLFCITYVFIQLVIVGVWITSAAYSAPKFIFVETIINDLGDGHIETICIQQRMKFNSEIFDMVNFGLLYVTPLLVMTVSPVLIYQTNPFENTLSELYMNINPLCLK